MDTAIEMSDALGIDKKRHQKWSHISKHLSDYSTQTRDGKTVFRYTEKGTPWWHNNTLGIQHIFPGNAIGLDSDPKLLEISRNTIDVMQRWRDYNGTNSFYPAAVRVGYDPNIILKEMRTLIADHSYPNGFKKDNPHGIENFSTVPCTINEMLCMGHQNVLRMFPVWPKQKDATFTNIRAIGAFLVSSELKNGKVQYVKIYSEQGRDCRMINPWSDYEVVLYRNGKKAEKLSGERFTFKTQKGEYLELTSPCK
jgi:alpha-L-fucosidase 2